MARIRRRLRRRVRAVRYSRHARSYRWAAWGVGGLVVLGVVWVVLTGLLARRQLVTLQDRLTQVQSMLAQGRVAEARELAQAIPAMADRASGLTSGPAWWVAAHVPVLGDPVEVTRSTTGVTHRISTDALPRLLNVATMIDPARLRVNGHTIRIGPLAAAAPQLTRAAETLDQVTDEVADLPAHTWFSAVNDGRAGLQQRLETIRDYVEAAARVSRVLPAMLGRDGETKRLFIGLQNESEMRGTGGLPGAFAIARVRDGTITFERFESDAALLPAATGQRIATGLNFGASYDALYGAADPTRAYVNSNISPQFPYAARVWAAMWQKLYHQHIDGVLAVDPTALSYFLAATGPTSVGSPGAAVTAENVVPLTQRDNYALFSDNDQRKNFLVAIFRSTSEKLLSGAGAPHALLTAASRASSEQRLLAWSEDPATERLIEQTSYSGDIAARGRPLSALVLNNDAGGKMDYYLQRNVNYVRTGCGPRRDVLVTITLTNNTPASGLPTYVTNRGDRDRVGSQPGDSHTLVDYFATGGSRLLGVMLDGKPVSMSVTDTLGRTVFRLPLELPRGAARTINLHLDEPAGAGLPQFWRQPGVIPLGLEVTDQSCG